MIQNERRGMIDPIDRGSAARQLLLALLLSPWLTGCGPDSGTTNRGAPAAAGVQPSLPAGARKLETAHYQILSSADPVATAQMAQAVEHLYASYTGMFPAPPPAAKLTLVLYRDRAEFKRHNRSASWAEGYYLWPRSHAYFDAQAGNPYHWTLHELIHQLAREVSGHPRRNRWIEEGLATYFSTSAMDASGLRLGEIDADTYPVWWLRQAKLSGDRALDQARGDFISIHSLLTGEDAPALDSHFNQYYICAWSLAHFLLHHERGKYADGYRKLIAVGGGAAEFSALIAPIDQVEAEWYPYLLQQAEWYRARSR